jgi:hypothetical protein
VLIKTLDEAVGVVRCCKASRRWLLLATLLCNLVPCPGIRWLRGLAKRALAAHHVVHSTTGSPELQQGSVNRKNTLQHKARQHQAVNCVPRLASSARKLLLWHSAA